MKIFVLRIKILAKKQFFHSEKILRQKFWRHFCSNEVFGEIRKNPEAEIENCGGYFFQKTKEIAISRKDSPPRNRESVIIIIFTAENFDKIPNPD